MHAHWKMVRLVETMQAIAKKTVSELFQHWVASVAALCGCCRHQCASQEVWAKMSIQGKKNARYVVMCAGYAVGSWHSILASKRCWHRFKKALSLMLREALSLMLGKLLSLLRRSTTCERRGFCDVFAARLSLAHWHVPATCTCFFFHVNIESVLLPDVCGHTHQSSFIFSTSHCT